ncbi:TetR/AcrR family transcriptional regulator [Planotetraspora sp. A-T 1434]|uniref:TetR/AcrR family transcriptional regulator n=1 Tax=Planotetraspora sp. A-T 1434 TaxID=2979219 RepID=UPI0021C19AB4|nr:TetR/AcrR family transcriptional regulator [Planotetraspora sp. A-T 1434]MCT9933963.1 TetR/AcrR family transcriptional regulator [Planotetraspora sp. A-T 1434]
MTTLDQGNETRSRILAAARELFAQRGYAATSLADIAAAVGLTKTAVAYHFHPKDRLAAELITPAAEDLLTLLGTEFPDGREFLRAFADFAVRHRAVARLLIEDIGGADDAPPGSPGEAIRTFRDEFYAKVAGPDPSPGMRIRAWAALGSVHTGVVKTIDLPEDLVRETLVAAALAVYDS